MFVARVVVSGSRRESWTVVGEDGQLVEPAERFLSFLTDAGRSPNTVKAYAHDLRDWFAFLAGRGLDWAAVTVEDVAAFVAWLRLPPSARGAGVAVLPLGEHCSAATINRKLAAVGSMYLSATLENEAIATVENEATQTDWMGDLCGGLGSDSATGCGRCSAAPGRAGLGHRQVDCRAGVGV